MRSVVSAVTGDYWSVWPVVFATNLLHEQRERATARAACRRSLRGASSTRFLDSAHEADIAVIPSGSVDYWRAQPGLPELDIRRSNETGLTLRA